MAAAPKSKNLSPDSAANLAQQLSEALLRERIVPRFVDSYVVEHGRHALQVHWNGGAALEFQSDLQMYEGILARTAPARRRKPFEAANHPFVDRCAFLLDSSFLEKARLAASRALTDVETLTVTIAEAALPCAPPSKVKPRR